MWGYDENGMRAQVPGTVTPYAPVTATVGQNGWTAADQQWWQNLPQPDPNDPRLSWGNAGVTTYRIETRQSTNGPPYQEIVFSNGQRTSLANYLASHNGVMPSNMYLQGSPEALAAQGAYNTAMQPWGGANGGAGAVGGGGYGGGGGLGGANGGIWGLSGFDAAYEDLIRILEEQAGGLDVTQARETERINNQYKIILARLQENLGKSLEQNEYGMADQGILRSGINVRQQGRINENFNQQGADARGAEAASLESLISQITNERNRLTQEAQRAEVERAYREMEAQQQQAWIEAQGLAYQQAGNLQGQQPQPSPTGQYQPGQPSTGGSSESGSYERPGADFSRPGYTAPVNPSLQPSPTNPPRPGAPGSSLPRQEPGTYGPIWQPHGGLGAQSTRSTTRVGSSAPQAGAIERRLQRF